MKVLTSGCVLYVLALLLASATMCYGARHPTLKSYQLDINNHKAVADRIIDYVLYGDAKGQVYERLAQMTDKFGTRLCGSESLENTIDYMVEKFKEDGLENVHKEPVTVPHWIRGKEWAHLNKPRSKPLAMLGLGTSIGTPKEGITAQAIVVRDFDELKAKADEVKGKIVVYNQVWQNYGQSVAYRSRGASEAAKLGGVASLIRSAASFSIYSPHTGEQTYEGGVKKIPTACITVEDAEMLWRMSNRGEIINITLYMEAHTLPDVTSYNTVAEIQGSKYPDEVVLVSGHLDSWDVGQGAMDDGAGSFISWSALSLIHQLGLKPKRTLRVVLWTCEEFGSYGGQQYFKKHRNEANNMNIVMESDMGTFIPYGLGFTGTEEAMSIMIHLAKTLLARINSTTVSEGAELSDIFDWPNVGVPGGSISTHNERYFNFHHSNGDTMTVQDPRAMDLCAAVWAVTAFTLADMEYMLPANRTMV